MIQRRIDDFGCAVGTVGLEPRRWIWKRVALAIETKAIARPRARAADRAAEIAIRLALERKVFVVDDGSDVVMIGSPDAKVDRIADHFCADWMAPFRTFHSNGRACKRRA